MVRNLKTLSLAFTVVLAIGALVAQGASAAEAHHFTTEEELADLTGHSETPIVITTGGATTICQTATFVGTKSDKTSTSFSLTPFFPAKYIKEGKEEQNCKLGAQNVTVTNNGCDFVFTNQTATNPATTSRKDAPIHFDCKHTGSITTVGAGVTSHFSDTHPSEKVVNQNRQGVRYAQVETGGKKAITVDLSVHGITYECTGGVNCTLIGKAATGSNAKITGAFILHAYKHGSAHQAGDLQNLTFNENVT